MNEHGGNPNKKNGRDETSLHNLCMCNQSNNHTAQQRRADCLMLILQWRGATLEDGKVEKVELGAQDEVSCLISTMQSGSFPLSYVLVECMCASFKISFSE